MTQPSSSGGEQFNGSGNLILVVMISLLLATGSVILVIAEAQEEEEIPAARPDTGPDHRDLDEGSAVGAEPVMGVSDEPATELPPVPHEGPPTEPTVEDPRPASAVEPREAEPAPAIESPEPDPGPSLPSSVTVVESDRVNIGRALGGSVEFAPTLAFDSLGDEFRDATFEISVEVRSKVVKTGSRVAVNATGIWVRITDTVRHVRLPAIKVDFQDGPFPRRVNRDDPSRPRIEPFNTALRLDAKSYVRQVEAAVRSALEAAKAKRGN